MFNGRLCHVALNLDAPLPVAGFGDLVGGMHPKKGIHLRTRKPFSMRRSRMLRTRSKTAGAKPEASLLADRVSSPCQNPSKTFMLRSRKVEAIKVHHLVPGRYEAMDKLLLRIRTSVDFSEGAEFGSLNRRRGQRVPVHLSSPVLRSRPSNTSASFETAFHSVPMSSRFTKKSLVSASGRLVKTPCRVWPEIGIQDAHAAHEHRHFGRGQGQSSSSSL